MLKLVLVVAALQGLQDEPPPGRVRLERDSPIEIVRFNRAEGLSLGWGGTAVFRESMTTMYGRARYAFGDGRPQGLLSLRRESESGRIELSVFSEMREADPLAPGLGPANTIPALLLSHDDGSYVLATGAEVRRRGAWRRGTQLATTLAFVHEEAPRATVRGGLAGRFPLNTPVLSDEFLLLQFELTGGEDDRLWFAGAEGTAAGASSARLWIGVEHRYEIGAGLDLALAGWAGAGYMKRTVPQREFRLGGARTLRGYDAGAFRGPAAWTASVDLGAAHRIVSPVVFVDLGQTSRDDAPAASMGAGLSLLRGVIRAHVAVPVDRRGDVRFDLVLNARR